MNGHTFSVREIAKILGVTKQAVQKRAKEENWPYENGRHRSRRFKFEDLPGSIKAAIIRAQVQLEDIALLSSSDPRPLPVPPRDLQDPAVARKLKAAQYIKSLPRYQGRDAAAQAFADIYGVHRATVWRWVEWAERYSTSNKDSGGGELILPKSKSFDPHALAFGLALYARNIKCGRKAAYKALAGKARRDGWRIGDYSSFTRLVKQVPEDVWVRIEKGDLGFEFECVPKIIRNWLAVPVQSVICGDQKIFDYEVYDPETDTIIIPNGYFWMDCTSRCINGAWIELGHYNSFTVGYALREALRYGIPDEAFTDWGKAEGAQHIAHIRDAIGGLVYTGDYDSFRDKYYLSHKKAQAEKPWQKPIENIMNQVDLIIKEHFPPGYRKRQADAWDNKETQRRLKSERKAGELMTVEEFIGLVFKVVDEHNGREKKLREGGSITPIDAFKAGLESQSRVKLADTTLDYICLPTYMRVPRQGKVGVQVRKGDYREFFSFKMSGQERVFVSVDPYDRTAAAVISDLEGNFVDLAEPIPRVVPGKSSEESQRFMEVRAQYMKEVRTKARQLKDGFDLVEKREVIAIGRVAHTARKAAQAREELEEAREHRKREGKVLKLEARKARAELVRNEQAQARQGFTVPEEPRARYRAWKSLDARRGALSEEEEAFWRYYQNTADFRSFKTLEEDFGEFMEEEVGS